MKSIEQIVSKTLNLNPDKRTKIIEELGKERVLPPDPELARIAAEAEKALKNLKKG